MRTREASGRQLTVAVNVRLAAGDMEALDGLCHRLDLERSEVMRRALRVGLKSFETVELPSAHEASA
jgi:hypothetical protein